MSSFIQQTTHELAKSKSKLGGYKILQKISQKFKCRVRRLSTGKSRFYAAAAAAANNGISLLLVGIKTNSALQGKPGQREKGRERKRKTKTRRREGKSKGIDTERKSG